MPVKFRLLFAALLPGGLCMSLPAADAPAIVLTPGGTFTLTFPDLPPTYHAIASGQSGLVRMTVQLPASYDVHRQHPLFVYLSGGDGGDGNSLGVPRALTAGTDFVCANVPLFKAAAPKAPGGEVIMRDPDARYMWPQFRTMLTRLEQTIPNLSPTRRVLGGFSNGAHATQGLIDESGGEIARQFCAFLFVEGGGRLRQYDLLRGKGYLIVSSSEKSAPRAEQICQQAKAAGARATHLAVDAGGHAFPPSSYPAVRDWLISAAAAE